MSLARNRIKAGQDNFNRRTLCLSVKQRDEHAGGIDDAHCEKFTLIKIVLITHRDIIIIIYNNTIKNNRITGDVVFFATIKFCDICLFNRNLIFRQNTFTIKANVSIKQYYLFFF